MIVNLGLPYEIKLKKIIEKGYAGNMTEAMRQAITSYYGILEEEENRLVGLAVADAMAEIESGKVKTRSHAEVKKMLGF